MQWLHDLQMRPFVGAESRLELIFRQLEEIVLFSTPDAGRRITALRPQQAALQEKIEAIETTNKAEAYTPSNLPSDSAMRSTSRVDSLLTSGSSRKISKRLLAHLQRPRRDPVPRKVAWLANCLTHMLL